MMKTVCRTSKLPMLHLCPSFLEPRDFELREPSEPSDNGSAAHAMLAPHVVGVDIDHKAVLAEYPDADPDEVRKLYRFGVAAWRRLGAFFPAPQTEVKLKSDLTNGTCDILGRGWLESVGDLLSIGDWKTGYRYADATWQMGGYAYSARSEFGMPESGIIKTAVIWLRLGEIEVKDWTDQDLDIFADLVREQAKGIGKAYNPGEHCRFCDGRLDCKVRDAWLRQTTAAITKTTPAELSPAKLASLYPQAKALEALLKEYNAALRACVFESGTLPIGDGRVIGVREVDRQSVLPREAWPILQREFGFSEDDMARCLKMSKSEVEKIIAERAPKREKAAAKKAAMERLESVGAVVHSVTRSLTIKKGDSE